MRVDEILVILQNKVAVLGEARKAAASIGDLEKVIQIDTDLQTTETTITQLTAVLTLSNSQA